MSRIFWDSMLFIYLLEDHPDILRREFGSFLIAPTIAGDSLYTSYLVLGEVMAGADKSPQSAEGTGSARDCPRDGLHLPAF